MEAALWKPMELNDSWLINSRTGEGRALIANEGRNCLSVCPTKLFPPSMIGEGGTAEGHEIDAEITSGDRGRSTLASVWERGELIPDHPAFTLPPLSEYRRHPAKIVVPPRRSATPGCAWPR